jgi:hypothetical protein
MPNNSHSLPYAVSVWLPLPSYIQEAMLVGCSELKGNYAELKLDPKSGLESQRFVRKEKFDENVQN